MLPKAIFETQTSLYFAVIAGTFFFLFFSVIPSLTHYFNLCVFQDQAVCGVDGLL